MSSTDRSWESDSTQTERGPQFQLHGNELVNTAPDAQVLAFGGGRFEVRGTLGSGGAGVVYRVFDRQLQREVALKHLRQASGRDLYRFKKEFRALADIVHPSLVALHELHATNGDWFFTMELIDGVSF